MPTFLFLAAICLLVAASTLLETDASPPPNTNTKLGKGPSSSGKAEPNTDASPQTNTKLIPGNAETNAGLTPDNQWAPCPPSPARFITRPLHEPLIVQFIEGELVNRTVLAVGPIPKINSGIFFFEVEILAKGSIVSIGLCTDKTQFLREFGPIGAGVVIGCGLNLAKKTKFYTLNKRRLEFTDSFVHSAADNCELWIERIQIQLSQ
uniref:Uncharacterized protein n=1 Tax=Globodera rostochiensis TaxID=31243 RepID=A0A914HDX7_GLORO